MPIASGQASNLMAMNSQHLDPGRHYSEPEIIPPGQGSEKELWPPHTFEKRATRRIYIARVGPLGSLLFGLIAAFFSVAVAVFLFGFLILAIPLAGVILGAVIVANILHAFSREPR